MAGLVALVTPGLGAIGIGGALLFGARDGALWSGIVGSSLGLTGEVHRLEDAERAAEVPLKRDEILVVVVADRARADEICRILRRHEVCCVGEMVAQGSNGSEAVRT